MNKTIYLLLVLIFVLGSFSKDFSIIAKDEDSYEITTPSGVKVRVFIKPNEWQLLEIEEKRQIELEKKLKEMELQKQGEEEERKQKFQLELKNYKRVRITARHVPRLC